MGNRKKSSSFMRPATVEYQRWMARYLPVEQEIMAACARRDERRWVRRMERNRALSRAFADLCEATEGRAVCWRENGFCGIDMALELATDAWARQAAERYFKLAGGTPPRLPRFSEIVSTLVLLHFVLTFNVGAVVSCCVLELITAFAGMALANLKHRTARPLYYERETARRRALAADRRRIVKRTTVNPCPTKEALLEAYSRRKDSKEAALRFGSLLHDLECYVDNSLRFAEGRITGRNHGVKGWLAENLPALACRYTTVMRYKAAAKKLKQLTELHDPQPAEAVLPLEVPAEKGTVSAASARDIPDEKVVRAVAIYRELAEGVQGATRMMARIDAFLDPARVEEATMLAVWRERYKNEITVRNKSRWWRRLRMPGRRDSGIISKT